MGNEDTGYLRMNFSNRKVLEMIGKHRITIKAEDQGTPKLSSSINVWIDVNDHRKRNTFQLQQDTSDEENESTANVYGLNLMNLSLMLIIIILVLVLSILIVRFQCKRKKKTRSLYDAKSESVLSDSGEDEPINVFQRDP